MDTERFGIAKLLQENKNADSEEKVSIEIGQLRDLVETIRVTALELNKDIVENKFSHDILEHQRLTTLYKELTGKELSDGWW